MLFLSKFCVIIARKPITAVVRIRPQQDSAFSPDAGFTLRPLQPPPPTIFFRSAAPALGQYLDHSIENALGPLYVNEK